jgi:hypothetical protein
VFMPCTATWALINFIPQTSHALKVLHPVAVNRSFANLAVEDGFVANKDVLRAYRIGIDASIWFFHTQSGQHGKNPELRVIFFHCCQSVFGEELCVLRLCADLIITKANGDAFPPNLHF